MEKTELIKLTTNIDGKEYYTVSVFAELTDRSEQAIRRLISAGNRFRKIKAIKVGQTILVEASEYTKYPFAEPGRCKLVTWYQTNGTKVQKTIH